MCCCSPKEKQPRPADRMRCSSRKFSPVSTTARCKSANRQAGFIWKCIQTPGAICSEYSVSSVFSVAEFCLTASSAVTYRPMKLIPPCVAEFVGTFTLIFVGIGAIANMNPPLQTATHLPINLLAIALAHGLAIAVMVAATLHISGGQLNPSVSIALMVTGKITPREGIAYIISQLAGAVVAAAICRGLFSVEIVRGGTPVLAPTTSIAAGIVIE